MALDLHGVMQQAYDFNCTGLLAGLPEVLLQVLAAGLMLAPIMDEVLAEVATLFE